MAGSSTRVRLARATSTRHKGLLPSRLRIDPFGRGCAKRPSESIRSPCAYRPLPRVRRGPVPMGEGVDAFFGARESPSGVASRNAWGGPGDSLRVWLRETPFGNLRGRTLWLCETPFGNPSGASCCCPFAAWAKRGIDLRRRLLSEYAFCLIGRKRNARGFRWELLALFVVRAFCL